MMNKCQPSQMNSALTVTKYCSDTLYGPKSLTNPLSKIASPTPSMSEIYSILVVDRATIACKLTFP